MSNWDFSQNGHFDSCLSAQLLSFLRNCSAFMGTPEKGCGSSKDSSSVAWLSQGEDRLVGNPGLSILLTTMAREHTKFFFALSSKNQ